MRTLVRRRLLVACLILAAGVASVAIGVQDPPAPGLPTVEAMTAGSAWRVEIAVPPEGQAMRSHEWLLDDGAGHEALLYVGATAQARTMMEWTGEVGYQGAGYVVRDQRDGSLRLSGGRQVAVGQATVSHLDDRRVLRYAVIGPSGVGRRGTDLLLPAVWNLVLGQPAAYYCVRVAVVDGIGAPERADDALAAVLSHLVVPRA